MTVQSMIISYIIIFIITFIIIFVCSFLYAHPHFRYLVKSFFAKKNLENLFYYYGFRLLNYETKLKNKFAKFWEPTYNKLLYFFKKK